MIIQDPKTIISFLEGLTSDYKGRTLKDILDCSDAVMEQCHDQVQWMFPLHEESNFAQTYPVLTKETIEAAKDNDTIKANLCILTDKMLGFYGMREGREDIDKQRAWCQEFNHNLLRITRIIRCLRFFGLENEAQDFYQRALKVGEHFGISNVTKAYWWRAAKEDVWKTLR